MTPNPGPSEPVTAQPSARNFRQLWAAFKARPRSYQIRIALVIVFALVAIVFAMPFNQSSISRVTSDDTPVPIKLDDGSRMLLLSHSEISVDSRRPDDLEVQVVAGSARFQIVRNPTRRFRVVAVGVEASTTGATLTVRLQNGAPRFSVDQGEAELRRPPLAALVAHLRAGESWPAAAPKASQPEKPAAEPGQAAPEAPQAGAAAQLPVDAGR